MQIDLTYIPITYKRWKPDQPLIETSFGTWVAVQNTGPLEIVGNGVGRLCCVGVILERVEGRVRVRLPDGAVCWVKPDPALKGFSPDHVPKWVTNWKRDEEKRLKRKKKAKV